MFGGARDQGFHTTKGITDFPAFWVFSFFIGNKTNLTSTYEPGDGLSQSILCGSVVEHRSTESKSLRFPHGYWEPLLCPTLETRQKIRVSKLIVSLRLYSLFTFLDICYQLGTGKI